MQLPEAAPMAVWPPLLAVAAPGGASEPHRHHSLHAVVARAGSIRVRVGAESKEVPGVLTGSDVEHAIDATGRDVLLLFVEPESVPGASLVAALDPTTSFIDGETRDALVADLSDAPRSSELESWAHRAVARLTNSAWVRPRMHPRVRRLLQELRELPSEADVSLAALADRSGLSRSRLMHVFTESVGIPLRPYLRWLRFQRAASALVSGQPLSSAAVQAGFSDAAHMTRTFKRMFGMPPSVLQQRRQ